MRLLLERSKISMGIIGNLTTLRLPKKTQLHLQLDMETIYFKGPNNHVMWLQHEKEELLFRTSMLNLAYKRMVKILKETDYE